MSMVYISILVLYKVTCSPLLYTFILVAIIYLLYSKKVLTTKAFLNIFCVGLLKSASL